MTGSDAPALSGGKSRGAASAIALAITLMLPAAACGSEPPPTTGEIFGEYARSTEVIGDEFLSANTPDRMANFASMGGPDELLGTLMAVRQCGPAGCAWPWPQGRSTDPAPGLDAALASARPGGSVYERKILVKHENGDLELASLFVIRKADGTSTLIDSTGERHTGGLAVFRQNNDLFESGDHLLLPRDITAVSGSGEIVVVSGHTPSKSTPWLVGGGIVLLAAAAAWAISNRLRRNRGDHTGPASG